MTHPVRRFLVIGLIVYAVDVAVIWALRERMGWSVVPATSAAFSAAFVVNFGLNRWVAFRSSVPIAGQALRFGVLVALNYLLTVCIVFTATELGAGIVAAKTIATAMLTVLNYLAYRYWVFPVVAGGPWTAGPGPNQPAGGWPEQSPPPSSRTAGPSARDIEAR